MNGGSKVVPVINESINHQSGPFAPPCWSRMGYPGFTPGDRSRKEYFARYSIDFGAHRSWSLATIRIRHVIFFSFTSITLLTVLSYGFRSSKNLNFWSCLDHHHHHHHHTNTRLICRDLATPRQEKGRIRLTLE